MPDQPPAETPKDEPEDESVDEPEDGWEDAIRRLRKERGEKLAATLREKGGKEPPV